MTPLCVHHEVSTCPAVGLLLCLPISGYVKAKSDAVFDHYMRSLQLLLTLALLDKSTYGNIEQAAPKKSGR